jgi:hypothetical protein
MSRLKLTGLKSLERAMDRTVRDYGKKMEAGLREAAKVLIREATDTVRIDTGALKASGMWYQVGKDWNTVITVGYGFPTFGFYDEYGREKVPSQYAVYHHEGTNPWFETAVRDMEKKMSDAIFTRVSK